MIVKVVACANFSLPPLFLRLCFTVDAPVYMVLFVGQAEDVLELLLNRSDAARVLAFNNVD